MFSRTENALFLYKFQKTKNLRYAFFLNFMRIYLISKLRECISRYRQLRLSNHLSQTPFLTFYVLCSRDVAMPFINIGRKARYSCTILKTKCFLCFPEIYLLLRLGANYDQLHLSKHFVPKPFFDFSHLVCATSQYY